MELPIFLKPFVIARIAAEIFSPQRVRLRLHQHGFSPVALDKIVTTNAAVKSGGVAVKVLNKLTSISVSQSQLMQLTEIIGKELEETRDQQVTEYLDETLNPDVPEPPPACAVATDGGRIFTRAENVGRGVHDAAWKETKIANLTSLSSQPCEVDPHPELPGCFGDKTSVGKLVREIKSIRNEAVDNTAVQGDDSSAEEDEASKPLVLFYRLNWCSTVKTTILISQLVAVSRGGNRNRRVCDLNVLYGLASPACVAVTSLVQW